MNPDLTKRGADVALTTFDLDATELEQIFLHERRLQLFASQSYLHKTGLPQRPEELENHRIILFDTQSKPITNKLNKDWLLTIGMPTGQSRKPFLRFNSLDCMCQAAEAGLGIIALSHDSSFIERFKLIRVLPNVEDDFLYHKQVNSGGGDGIRTHDTLLTYTRFPIVRLQPLGHPSLNLF